MLFELKDKKNTASIDKLVYKKYGASSICTDANKMYKIREPFIQSLVAYEYARRGWGPRTFGILDEVRIEEYVESETLNPENAFTSDMAQDIGKAYANFHSMKVPIVTDQGDILMHISLFVDQMIEEFKDWIDSGSLSEELISDLKLKPFSAFPFKDEINWIKETESKIKQRVVLSCIDSQYLNRLVRFQQPNDLHTTRTVLIDYDLVTYCVRGIDLAGHFVSRMLSWNNFENFVSGSPYPNEEEREEFLNSYLKQCKILLDDFDEESLDSIENLKLETDLHSLTYVIIVLSYSKAMFEYFKLVATRCSHLSMLIELYDELKGNFCRKYASLLSTC